MTCPPNWGELFVTAAGEVREPAVVQTEEVEHRHMEVTDVVDLLGGFGTGMQVGPVLPMSAPLRPYFPDLNGHRT